MMLGFGLDCGVFFYSATHGYPQLLLQFNRDEQCQFVFYKYQSLGHGGLDGFKKSRGGLGPVGTNGDHVGMQLTCKTKQLKWT